MYGFKPERSWESMSAKLMRKFKLYTCEEAWAWFTEQADNPDAEELQAKTFDRALERVKVSNLDRRIYWSQLDTDASGGISFEEFAEQLCFPDDWECIETPTTTRSPAANQRCFKAQSPRPTSRSKPPGIRTSRSSCDSTSGVDITCSAALSHMAATSEPANYGMFCQLLEQNRELVDEIKKLRHPIEWSSEEGDSKVQPSYGMFCELLQQNRELMTEMKSLRELVNTSTGYGASAGPSSEKKRPGSPPPKLETMS
jgi:hypothetical protein